MGRWCTILATVISAIGSGACYGQWYGGWGGYTEAATPYSAAVRSQAQMAMAQGVAAENYAKASIANEQARTQYLKNQAMLLQMRRENRAAIDARNEERKQEQKARAALRPPPKPLTEVYARLSSDQIDPLTGEIHWPDCLNDGNFANTRRIIEHALLTQAEYGANDRTTKIISDTSHEMMKILSSQYGSLGSENYGRCRKFLNSLSVEGNHAQEALK